METCGFSKDEIQTVWRILAGILHMGNIAISGSGENSSVSNKDVAKKAADLFGTDVTSISNAITFRTVETAGDSVKSPLNVAKVRQKKGGIFFFFFYFFFFIFFIVFFFLF